MNTINLFCLPHAGGSATMYLKWKKRLPDWIKVCPIELQGRGSRIAEQLPASLEEMIEDGFSQIQHLIDEGPYALLGHSMGGLLAFELAHRIRQASLNEPQLIFLSGRSAPHLCAAEITKPVHQMTDEELRLNLLNIGGVTEELFESASLSKLFLPIIRADYKAIETYCYKQKPQLLHCELVVMNGDNDHTTLGRYDEWHQYTTGTFYNYLFQGGHFFIHEQEDEVLTRIVESLDRLTVKEPNVYG